MRWADFEKNLHDDKKVLRTGMFLLAFAAALVLLVLRFDAVWGAAQMVSATLTPVVGGIVVAYVLNVFVHLFEDVVFKPFQKSRSRVWKKLCRPLSVLLAYVIVALVILFIALFIVPGLIESMGVLAETAQKTLPGTINNCLRWANEFARENDLDFMEDFLKSFNWTTLLSNATKTATDFVASLVGIMSNVASGVFSMIMGFIFSIYMLTGKEKLLRGVRSALLAFLPRKAARSLSHVGAITNRVFFSFIKGQLTECVILGVLCYIGMSLLGLDYALLISSVVALGALIPILGAYAGAAVGVIVLLLVNPFDSLIFLIFLLILQQVEGNLIYPRVVGSSIGLPPVWTLFAVVFWGGVMGIAGIWLGTPLTAVIYRLFRSSVRGRLRKKNMDPMDPKLYAPSPFADENLDKEEGEQQKLEEI